MLSAAFIRRSDILYKAIASNCKSFCYNLKATALKGEAVRLSAAVFDRCIDWYSGHSVRDAIFYFGSLPPKVLQGSIDGHKMECLRKSITKTHTSNCLHRILFFLKWSSLRLCP